MISHAKRISKHYFPGILRNPSISGVYFKAIIAPSISGSTTHAAVIISKKYAKLAVTRNHFRRTVFKVISDHLKTLPKKSIIFVMQKPITHEKTLLGRKNVAVELSNDINDIITQIHKKYAKNN
jgi:ribonuclease P protein component